MAKRIKTIFDRRAYTPLILTILSGMKNPLDYNKRYSSSWYAVVKPNLETFFTDKQPIRGNDLSQQKKNGDFQFLNSLPKIAKGKEQFELNLEELLKYFRWVIQDTFVNLTMNNKLKSMEDSQIEKHMAKYFKLFRHYSNMKTDDPEKEYHSIRAWKYFEMAFDKTYFQDKKDIFRQFLSLEILLKRNKDGRLYSEFIVQIFQDYCMLLLNNKIIRKKPVNEIMSDFFLGLASSAEIIHYDERDLEDIKMDNFSKFKAYILSMFIKSCQFYEECIKIRRNKHILQISPAMILASKCLCTYVQSSENPFLEVTLLEDSKK